MISAIQQNIHDLDLETAGRVTQQALSEANYETKYSIHGNYSFSTMF